MTCRAKLLWLAALLLAGCAPATASPALPSAAPASPVVDPTASDLDDARQTLVDFFDYLAAGDYAAAEALHAENADFYEGNRQNNPDVDPLDRVALLQAACERQLICMAIERIVSAQPVSQTEFLFVVEFTHPEGGTFVLGPCCGADETEMPPMSEFEYRVEKVGGQFFVIDGPVYVP